MGHGDKLNTHTLIIIVHYACRVSSRTNDSSRGLHCGWGPSEGRSAPRGAWDPRREAAPLYGIAFGSVFLTPVLSTMTLPMVSWLSVK